MRIGIYFVVKYVLNSNLFKAVSSLVSLKIFILGLDDLDQLVLNYNNLTALHAKWFKGLNKLHDLKICNNKISTIDDGAFDGLEGKFL